MHEVCPVGHDTTTITLLCDGVAAATRAVTWGGPGGGGGVDVVVGGGGGGGAVTVTVWLAGLLQADA
jgi:hypothetical protein